MLDKIIVEFDKMLKTLTVDSVSDRAHPDKNIEESNLSINERNHALGLMRINHCGEVCAQGLYQGQALTSRDETNRKAFENASFEEVEHLAWTKQRVTELGGKTSILNPFFYIISLGIGITAGLIGDKWNLAFLEETELQVEQHLGKHLQQLPPQDAKSRAIVQQMRIDEKKHADMAHNFGAAVLPAPIKQLMQLSSKVMTKVVYHI